MVYRLNQDIQRRIEIVWEQSFQNKTDLDQKLALVRIFVDCMEGAIGVVRENCSDPEEVKRIEDILRKKYQA